MPDSAVWHWLQWLQQAAVKKVQTSHQLLACSDLNWPLSRLPPSCTSDPTLGTGTSLEPCAQSSLSQVLGGESQPCLS